MKRILGMLFILLLTTMAFAQSGSSWPGHYYPGYAKSVKGGGFQYHSPQPEVKSSLLLRSVDSTQYIEWETGIVPSDTRDEMVNFIWIFGIDANADSHHYRVDMNGQYLLTFSNPVVSDKTSWTVTGERGAELTFRPTMLDKFNDPMGYSILSVPVSMIRKGLPQVIRVTGETAGSRTWYMTFESDVREKVWISQEEAVKKGVEGNTSSLLVHIVHLGDSVNGNIEIVPGKNTGFSLQPGYNRIDVKVPEIISEENKKAIIQMKGKTPVTIEFQVRPVRHWTIYLVQHTHTDIGYTRPQTEILPEHLRYIDYALDYCDQTDSLPAEARFRWTCETSWAVREYLKSRPQGQIDRLKQRIKEGRIEVTGLFLNSSDLADEPSIVASLQPVKFFRDNGIPVRAAMQSDINGVPWCLVDYFTESGIHYLNMAQNTHRAHKPFNKPTVFWWESPSGKRIMVNRPEHYMWGNNLGILTNSETFGRNLFQHLGDIVATGYPFDRYAIQFSGYLTDNSPPSTTACDLVKRWNETYVWPKLQLATISEFLEYMEQNHKPDIPVARGAWPDWWMDGFGSAAMETANARMAHADFNANQGLMSLAVVLGNRLNDHIRVMQDNITDDLALYDEHTFGAAESIADPWCENSVVQWMEKASYVWEAVKKNRILREEVMGLIQSSLPKTKEPSISVINTMNWTRSGLVTLYIDHQLLPRDKSFTIVDESEQAVPVQPLMDREDGTYWALWAEDVPPLGYRTYRIRGGNTSAKPLPEQKFQGILENGFYRIVMDTQKGAITGLYDKQLQKDLIDNSAPYGLGQFVYEQLKRNRSQLEQLKLEEFQRMTWKVTEISGITTGPIWQSIRIKGFSPDCADKDGVSLEVRLFGVDKRIEFSYSMKKLPVTDPEGVYIAFPFKLNNAGLVYEVAGASVVPGKDQLEGSASDWNGIQNFVAVRNDSAQVVFVSPEIPLVQLGDINLGKFARIANPKTTTVYSWVLNNYWTTNFRASQEGALTWSYQITSAKDPSNLFAAQFGHGVRTPFLTRIFPGFSEESVIIPRSFMGHSLQRVLMVSARPAQEQDAVILQFRELEGRTDSVPLEDVVLSTTTLVPSMQPQTVSEVNILGEPIRLLWEAAAPKIPGYYPVWLKFEPCETKSIKLTFPNPRKPRFR